MKRIIFYSLIVLQIVLVLVLVFQFEQISTTGKEIKLKTKIEFIDEDYPWEYIDNIYVEYEINTIPHDKWESEKDNVTYNDKIYVLLKQSDDGFYEVEKASVHKLEKSSDDEVVLVSRSSYGSYSNEPIRVEYPFNNIKHIEQYGQFHSNQILNVTLLVVKSGQFKIKSIDIVK